MSLSSASPRTTGRGQRLGPGLVGGHVKTVVPHRHRHHVDDPWLVIDNEHAQPFGALSRGRMIDGEGPEYSQRKHRKSSKSGGRD
jgi:hypothetical protein